MLERLLLPNRSGSTAIHTEQDELDGRRGWRPTRGRVLRRSIEKGTDAVGFGPGHRGEIDEVRSSAVIQDIPGRTHPGAERRAMGGFLMMLVMMGFVRDRLRRGKPPDHKNTHNEETGKKPCDHSLHRISHCNRTGGRMVLEAGVRVKTGCIKSPPYLPGRIRKKFAVYCADYFVR